MADVLGDEGFAQAVGTEQDQVAAFADEVQRQGAFDRLAVDLLGPGPVEVGDGLEAPEARVLQATFQAAACAFPSVPTCARQRPPWSLV